MKKLNNTKKTRRIAIALASLSMISAMAMPAASIKASAAEVSAIVEELPEASTETTVIANTDENVKLLETVAEIADEVEEATEETTEEATEETTKATAEIKEVTIENTEFKEKERERVRVQNEKLLSILKAVGKKAAAFGVSKIPTVGSTLENVLNGIFGIIDPEKPAPVPLTAEEFASGIDDLKAVISDTSNVIISDIEDAIKISNQEASFKRLKSQITDLENDIKSISDDENLTEDQKLLQIGQLIGKNFDNLSLQVGNFKAVTRATSGQSSIFQTMYHRYASNGQVMFAQEAKDKVQANIDHIYATLFSGYACIMECLNAQLYVSQLSDKTGLSEDDLSEICNDASKITRQMNTLTEVVFGMPEEVSETYDVVWYSDTEPEAKEGRTIEKQVINPVTLLAYDDASLEARKISLSNEAKTEYLMDLVERGVIHNMSMQEYIDQYIASKIRTVYKVTDTITEKVEVLPENSLTGAYDAFNRINGQTYIGEGLEKAVKLSPNMYKAGVTSWKPDELTAILRKQVLSAEQIKKINDYAHNHGKTLLRLAKDAGFNVTDNDLKTRTFIPTKQEATDDRDWKANVVDTIASWTFGDRTDLCFYFHGINATDIKGTEKKIEYCRYKKTGGFWKYWKGILGGNFDEYEISMSSDATGNLFMFQNYGA